MANLVLYRKYRPQSFKDVVGQEHIVNTVANAIENNDFSHSYIFTGPRGTGKTTLARLIAKSLNCASRKEGEHVPCQKCVSCQEIAKGISVDIIEIDAASNRGVDEIRQLKENIRFAPTRGKFKVYIIDEVHMLTKEAFNALLKTLEEPPEHAIFIMATTEINKVIPTIISRSQRFDFRKLTRNEIKGRLAMLASQENKKVDERIFDLVAARSGGSLRDAESMLGQAMTLPNISFDQAKSLFGFADFSEISRFMSHIAAKEKKEALSFLNDINDKGTDWEDFAKSALNYIRFMLYLKADEELSDLLLRDISQDELGELKAVSAQFELPKIQKLSQLFLDAANNIKNSPIPQLPMELATVEIIEN